MTQMLIIVITINITLKVNLYFNEHFNGEEEYSYVDKPQLNFDNRALSLIGERLVDACRRATFAKICMMIMMLTSVYFVKIQ